MIVRTMIAGAVLVALAAGCAPRVTSPANLGSQDGTGSLKLKEKVYLDDDMNVVTVLLDGSQGAKNRSPVTVVGPDKQPIEVRGYALTDTQVCLPLPDGTPRTAGTKPGDVPCKRAHSMTEGASFKVDSSSCVCCVINQHLWCYGTTCPR